MVSGDLQSKHFPVSLQGVLMSNLWALIGAATFLARFMALSRVGADLVDADDEDYLSSVPGQCRRHGWNCRRY